MHNISHLTSSCSNKTMQIVWIQSDEQLVKNELSTAYWKDNQYT